MSQVLYKSEAIRPAPPPPPTKQLEQLLFVLTKQQVQLLYTPPIKQMVMTSILPSVHLWPGRLGHYLLYIMNRKMTV